MTGDNPFTAEVAGYLACCALFPVVDSRYHPTADGAVKTIWHRRYHDKEADQLAENHIRAAFAALTNTPVTSVAPALQSPEPQDRAVLIAFGTAGVDPDDIPA